MLHSKPKAIFDDTECAKLVFWTFCQFFADKVNKICDNISQVTEVISSSTFHSLTTWWTRVVFFSELAQTLACSFFLSRLDYCNALLYGAPHRQHQQASACPKKHSSVCFTGAKAITYQFTTPPVALAAGQTANFVQVVRTTTTPSYFSQHIRARDIWQTLHSSSATALSEPFYNTAFSNRAFRYSAPATWNSVPCTVTDDDTLGTFKSSLKTFLFCQAFN